MPRAGVNGDGDDPMAPPESSDEALVWDTGLSLFLGRLEEDLIRWHSEERVKAKERDAKCSRDEQDAIAVEGIIRESAAAQELKVGEDQPWQEKIKELVTVAREQRDEMQQVCDLLRSHIKLHPLDQSGLAATSLLAKLPSEGQSFTASGTELPTVTKLFLDFAEKQLLESIDGRQRQRGEGGVAKEKKKRKGGEKKAKKTKAHKAGKSRAVRSAEASFESDWSTSRSPSMSIRRRERRPRHRRYTPSVDSRSLSDSRSCSKSRSRGYQGAGGGGGGCRVRPYRGRPPRRHDMGPGHKGGHGRFRGGGKGGGGGGPRRGGGGGGAGHDEHIDIPVEIDRFCKVNKLESRCEKILRDLSPPLARHVMGFGGGSNTFELSGDVRDPTAVVLARIRKAREDRVRGGGAGKGPPRGRRGSGERPARSISSRSRSRHSRSPNGGVADEGPDGASGGPGKGGQFGGSNAVPLGRPAELTPRPPDES